jgi:hypothetical protein
MITIHQSINGDKDGAYALLATSMENIQEAKRICNTTDMRARPAEGIEWSPALRGFAYDKFYLIVKTFKDTTPGVRMGRIFSHALVIEKKDLLYITDLNAILAWLPEQANKAAQLQPIPVEPNSKGIGVGLGSFSREAKVINALLHLADYKNTIVWVGREGFIELVAQVWRSIGSPIREKINFDIAFHPREIDVHRLNIICVPPSVISQWNNTGYCIINTADQEELKTTAAFYLGGQYEKGKPMSQLINQLEIEPESLNDYTYLEDIANGLENIKSTMAVRPLLPLAALLSKFSPDTMNAQSIKSKVLDKIVTLLRTATGQEVVGLHNVDWTGFRDASAQIIPQLQLWLDKRLFVSKEDSLPVVRKVVEGKVKWWCEVVEVSLKKHLKKWEPSYASLVWSWIQHESSILTYIGNCIPASSEVEMDLVEACPIKISEGVINDLVKFSLRRNWLTLHGILLLKIHSPEEAVKRQLLVDCKEDHLASLKRMAQSISDEELIVIALQNYDSRISKITGERIAGNKILLSKLRVDNATWRHLWLESMNYVPDPWNGIEEPQSVLFELMNQITKGDKVELALLQKLSQTQHVDLTNYPARPQIWKLLPIGIKDTFLQATALKVIRQLSNGKTAVEDLEDELKNTLASQNVFSSILDDIIFSTAFKLQLFFQLADLSQDLFTKLLLKQPLSHQDAITAGQIIATRNWRQTAQAIAEMVHFRVDLKPALWECKYLLNFFTRVALQINGGLKRDAISKDEWWAEFLIQCFEIYPRGPVDRGIWVQAGGDEYDLIYHVSGQEMWLNAINRLRRHSFRKITAENLLRKMVSENPKNQKLQILLNLYYKL